MATVRLTIDSDPSGATVTDVAMGVDLGTTPLVLERAPSTVPLKVRIARTGWKTSTRELDIGHDGHEVVALAEGSSAGGPTGEPAHPSGKPVKAIKPAHPKEHLPHHVPTPVDEEPAKL